MYVRESVVRCGLHPFCERAVWVVTWPPRMLGIFHGCCYFDVRLRISISHSFSLSLPLGSTRSHTSDSPISFFRQIPILMKHQRQE